METEGSSGPKPEEGNSNENKVIQFPSERVSKLPSERIEAFSLPNPDFNVLDFQMYLPKSSRGFTFKTDVSETKGPYDLSPEEKDILRKHSEGQMTFAQGNKAKAALDEYRRNPTEENKKAYEAARLNYTDRLRPKVGIRNPRRSGDTITFDTRPLDFQTMKVFASSEDRKQLEIGAASATSANILFTEKDGSKRLMVALRNRDNYSWRDNPGSGAAGYFDGNYNEKSSKESPTQGHRTLRPVDNKTVIGNALKEMEEELGIEEKDVKKSVLTGFVVEKGDERTHHEFTADFELKISADEAREKSRAHKVENEQEFKENWVDIEATPEAILTLCTQTLCPLAQGHYGAFVATGYRLMLARDGQRAADEYKRKLEIGILENKERIDGTVRQYIRNNMAQNPNFLSEPTPDQLKKFEAKLKGFLEKNPNATEEERSKMRENFFATQPKYDPDGFTPLLLPEEQGLPDARTALMQTGLIKDPSKIVMSQEEAKAA